MSEKEGVDFSGRSNASCNTPQMEVCSQENINSDDMPAQEAVVNENYSSDVSDDYDENYSEPRLTNIHSKTEHVSYTHKEYVADENGAAYLENHVDIFRKGEPLS